MKYTITMGCGHEDTVELFGKGSEREWKLEYFKSSGLCKECYKKQMDEKAKAEGLIFNASVLPFIDDEDGGLVLSIWFSGDTKSHKEEIKAIGGYSWSPRQSADDYYADKRPPMCWNQNIKAEHLEANIKSAKAIGAKCAVTKRSLLESIHFQIAIEKQKKWKEKQARIAEIEKPPVPEIIKGHRWNQKIYGKDGNHSIYPDGQRVMITDEQANELNKYVAARTEYNAKIDEIEKECKF
jgi:hypothetical protein